LTFDSCDAHEQDNPRADTHSAAKRSGKIPVADWPYNKMQEPLLWSLTNSS